MYFFPSCPDSHCSSAGSWADKIVFVCKRGVSAFLPLGLLLHVLDLSAHYPRRILLPLRSQLSFLPPPSAGAEPAPGSVWEHIVAPHPQQPWSLELAPCPLGRLSLSGSILAKFKYRWSFGLPWRIWFTCIKLSWGSVRWWRNGLWSWAVDEVRNSPGLSSVWSTRVCASQCFVRKKTSQLMGILILK